MDKIRLGRTNLMVTRSGFGALPIQRVGFDEAILLLQKAYNNGMNFFDTARGYTDSEEKMGRAFLGIRKNIIIASKSKANTKKQILQEIETSLKNLKTDYIDLYQLHNPKELSNPDDPDSAYAGVLEAKKRGLIRFIGISNHRLNVAMKAAESNLYDTIQFPLNSISSQADLQLIEKCKEKDIGVIAMKGLSGGLITNAASTFAFLRQYDNVVPIWGIQREWELDEFLAFEKNPPMLDQEILEVIKKDREELAGEFCRACGYCMPCSVGIEIPTIARMGLLLKRAPFEQYMEPKWREKVASVKDCTVCGQCKTRCPYGLDIPVLLKTMMKEYEGFYSDYCNNGRWVK